MQLAIRYLIPVIDVGAVIKSKEGLIQGIFGRVTTFYPGEACLFCRKRIDPKTIQLEGLSAKEREGLVREGYAEELPSAAPAVIMFTTAVATQAVSELMHRLTGFMGSVRQSSEVLFLFHESEMRRNRSTPDAQCLCSQKKLWGKGDGKRFLDLSWPQEPTPI
jgi:hypothetical protein